MTRFLSVVAVALLGACAGSGAAPPPKTATQAPGKASPPDPEALAYDCTTLEKALASFAPPADDAMDGIAIAKSYQGAAVSLRTTKLETNDVRETSKAMADLFEKIAANGPALDKDFRALRAAAEHAREKVGSFENAVVGADTTCVMAKGKEPACPEVTKVLATHPVLRRGDTQDPSAYLAKLGAFRKDVVALHPKDGQVKHMLEVVEQEAGAVETHLGEMSAAHESLDEHSFAGESKAISGRLDALCPRKKSAAPPPPKP